MRFVFIAALTSISIFACKKEDSKPKAEELKGYSSQGNLLVVEVADTFIKVIEYNLPHSQAWDSMPVYINDYWYVDSIYGFVGDYQVKNADVIGFHTITIVSGNFNYFVYDFPHFYPYGIQIQANELIINKTESVVSNSKFTSVGPGFPEESQEEWVDVQNAWDKINNYRVVLQYRAHSLNSKIGLVKSIKYPDETRYYFFLAKLD